LDRQELLRARLLHLSSFTSFRLICFALTVSIMGELARGLAPHRKFLPQVENAIMGLGELEDPQRERPIETLRVVPVTETDRTGEQAFLPSMMCSDRKKSFSRKPTRSRLHWPAMINSISYGSLRCPRTRTKCRAAR